MTRSMRAALAVLASTAALALATRASAAETTRYVIFTGDGTRGGEQVVQRSDDGRVDVRFIFKNNGRGPELEETIRLAPDGTMAEYGVKGKVEMGGSVQEHFVRDGNQAQWQSNAEKGSATVQGPALYVPLSSSFETASIAIGVLAARPDASLPLLPSGALHLRKIDEMEVAAKGGQKRRVQLVALTGLGFTPSFYWATTDARPRLFSMIYPGWMTLIEEGFETSTDAMAARQRQGESALLKEMAATLRHPLRGLTVVRNARVFDSESGRLGAPSDVYLLRGRITAVVPTGALGRRADQEIDAAGRVMLPGLYDMHAHLDRWDGVLHLAAGVTTIRDMGNNNDKMQRMLDEQLSGELLLPQVVPCGFLEGDSPFASRGGFVIKTYQEAKDAVDWYAAHGYPQLKIYNSFPKGMVRDIVAYAHQRGMRVSGHVPVFMRAAEVVEQGFDEVQHINQVMLNFLVTPTTDTRTLDRFYLPAEKVASLDFESKPVRDLLALLKQHKTVIDPTLATFDFIAQRDGDIASPYAAVADHLPPDVQRGFRLSGMQVSDEAAHQRYKKSYAKMVEFVGRMHRAGIPLVAGTDALAGFTLHSELELYVKAGLTPSQVLQVATRNAALYSRTSGERGRIAPGRTADLVLVDGDPTVNIGDLRRVVLVVTQGSLIMPSEVYRAIGVKPFVSGEPKLDTVSAELPAAATVSGADTMHWMGVTGMGHRD